MEIGTEQLCKFGCSKNRCQDGIRHARYLLGEKPFVVKGKRSTIMQREPSGNNAHLVPVKGQREVRGLDRKRFRLQWNYERHNSGPMRRAEQRLSDRGGLLQCPYRIQALAGSNLGRAWAWLLCWVGFWICSTHSVLQLNILLETRVLRYLIRAFTGLL